MSRKIANPNQGNQTINESGPVKWYIMHFSFFQPIYRMAPEQLMERHYSIKTDAWAFGITLYGNFQTAVSL